MSIKGIIFDLDGTLLDTLEDLADGVNAALRDFSFPERSREEVRHFVGNGVRHLIRQAVPAGTDSATLSQVHGAFMAHYRENMTRKTRPYPGVVDLLESLALSGYSLGVLSNKPHGATEALVRHFFPDRFSIIMGHKEGNPRKPDPTMLLQMVSDMGLKPEEVCYVGDSEVDVATCQQAQVAGAFCLWGFRSEEALKAAGAGLFLDEPAELLAQLLAGEVGL
ncbi:HAD family hydrolase [Peptococcus simiae]|uniref:HAD family hydrolase n=1 Tax=Peptococcus simiae TaxID=1643805 RepID=UPI0039815962